jgi:hypothetical protein
LATKGPFGTASLKKIQCSFTNFTMKQLRLRVDKVGCSVWLKEQLQLHENEILVGMVSTALETMFFTYKSIVVYNIFIEN